MLFVCAKLHSSPQRKEAVFSIHSRIHICDHVQALWSLDRLLAFLYVRRFSPTGGVKNLPSIKKPPNIWYAGIVTESKSPFRQLQASRLVTETAEGFPEIIF